MYEHGDPQTQNDGSAAAFAAWSPALLEDCHRTLQTLHRYWVERCGGRSMPARSDIDPVDLKPLLPLLILIDVVSDARRYVYRLVGTHEVEMRGSDPTGKPIGEAYYAESAGETARYLDQVVRTRQPVLYRGIYRPLSTRTQREDVIFLPLSKDGETVSMIMVLGHIAWIKDEEKR
ncbi:MAG TPA: PAS domain-containing protein [Dongiaceae bacterium]